MRAPQTPAARLAHNLPNGADGLFAVAPMMDYTNRFLRFLLRRLSARATLYTEMVTANTLVNCDERELPRFLERELGDHPTVLQIGGSDPSVLKRAAARAAPWGYDAINLNCGCPSDRVAGAGCFGAALMREPELVARCCTELASGAPDVPVSVKIRVGVADSARAAIEADEEALYDGLASFVDVVAREGGVHHFALHARQAVLGGLSPAQNREVPPLRPVLARRLAADFPHLSISLNGGIQNLAEARAALGANGSALAPPRAGSGVLSGVMVGRAVVSRPWTWATVDTDLYGAAANPAQNRLQLLEEYAAFAESVEVANPQRLRHLLVAPVVNLFAGEPNGKKFRVALDAATKKSKEEVSFSSMLLGSARSTLSAETLLVSPGTQWDFRERCYLEPAPTAREVCS